ncbi:lipid-A-disaccharide synthase [Ferruginibacter albus]|uniref:lipid-A-disaccharide synthase n=1 Tax=Ferruginibacter albus TaxID=2875540 RepID=UPI001CC52618|nr:lipid-A-disaccharide synthase [Ferruginibacter albus]UAY52693.1 lipid-A-disaccharide synthase [Ferruginibacter albus]
MRYYIIAGEASGDLHGSNLIKELQQLDPSATIRCWGGDKMQATGAKLVKHYRDLAFMGFLEVVKNLKTILRNLAFCKEDILQFKPDALVLIDYPGFNLRIAKWAKQNNLKVIYYISPQVWAWKESRVKSIKQCVDKMLVILPFEKDFYKKWNYDVEYLGHPLVKVIDDFKSSITDRQSSKKTIAVLPGSRKQEILLKLPLMLETSKHFPEYEFVVAKAPGLEDEFYSTLLAPYKNVSSVSNKTYELLNNATAALVTSGTATLETALFGVPEVVCYKGSNISYQIAKRLIKIKYICLVNLIMDKLVVKELIQDALTVENLTKELNDILNNEQRKQQLKKDYADLKSLLAQGGNASANAAKSIYTFLTSYA